MKTYKQDASEIMARGKAAYRKKQTARRALLGTVAGVLVFAVALGIWKQTAPHIKNTSETSTTVAPGEDESEAQTEIVTEALTEILTQGEGAATAAPTEAGTYALPESATGSESQTAAPPAQEDPNAPATDIAETAVVPRWEEAPCYTQYPTLEYEGRTYQTTGVPIDPSLAGEALGEAVSLGYDEYAEEKHRQTVTVARIGNIAPQCAVCTVMYGETYAYVNPNYVPATLGQFIADLDLKNTARFGMAYMTERMADNTYIFFRFADCDDAVIWNRLLADESVPNEPGAAYGATLLSFRFDLPALGYENRALWLTEDGYLVTNILETAKAFSFSWPDAFIDYMRLTVPFEAQENATFPPEEIQE